MKKYYLFILAIGLIVTGCDIPNVTVDNPTDGAITVNVDGSDYEVPAQGSSDISVKDGDHALVVKDAGGNVIQEGSFNKTSGNGLLNATATGYVIYREVYGEDDVEYDEYKHLAPDTTIDIDTVSYFGPIEYYGPDVLYIKKDWDYDLDDDLPETIYITDGERYEVKSKIYRQERFEALYSDLRWDNLLKELSNLLKEEGVDLDADADSLGEDSE